MVIEEAVLALSQPGANYTKAMIESHDFLMRLLLGVVGLAAARKTLLSFKMLCNNVQGKTALGFFVSSR